jgi:hypothetical protein
MSGEDGRSIVEYVVDAATRESIVTELADGRRTARALCRTLEASESGVNA